MTKINLAIVNLTAGGMSGGYRKYIKNMIPLLSKSDFINKILVIYPDILQIDQWFDSIPNVEFSGISSKRKFLSLHFENIDTLFQKFKPDLIFLPVERGFRYLDVPVVNMLRNMEPVLYPFSNNPVIEKIKNLLRRRNARIAVKKADKIIAVSNFVKEYMISHWKIADNKIDVVYHGVNKFITPETKRPDMIPESLTGKFIFTAGSIRPARGIEDLIHAFPLVQNPSNKIEGIVIAGDTDRIMTSYKSKLLNLAKQNGLDSKIIWTGSLPEKEMNWCFQNSLFFVMTSRVESFGQTGVEAMSNGCICVSAKNSALTEIFSDCAFFYSAGDFNSLAQIISDLMNYDKNRIRELSEKSLKRAGDFSWEQCANNTIQVFSNTLNCN